MDMGQRGVMEMIKVFGIFGSENEKAGAGGRKTVWLVAALLLAACETTKPTSPPVVKPVQTVPSRDISEMKVEIYEPKEQPSVDIYDLPPDKFKELMGYPKPGSEPEPVQEASVSVEPEKELSPLQRAAKAKTPDEAIAILQKAPKKKGVKAALDKAYAEKLDVDLAQGKNKGAAKALVYLADLDLAKPGRAGKIAALKKYARASELDANNKRAAGQAKALRAELKPYADKRHKEAVSFFVAQDFAAAVRIWEDVLIIDPDNSAAANWYSEAKSSLGR